ncbi:hypothetical protein [Thiolinea disciformis]|uniref:hypothetical protein n=1 Tax=Thiolinea disciformis TaxID=125614 RepID=UPI000361E12E|nr:hypothetical protein [Thiolinea disciformis]
MTEASYSTASHVIETGDVITQLFKESSDRQKRQMMSCFANSQELKRAQLEERLTTQLQQLRDLINGQTPGVNPSRLEELFKQLMQSEKMRAFFGNACTDVKAPDGTIKRISNASILRSFINRPQRIRTEFLRDTNQSAYGLKFWLTGDRSATLSIVDVRISADGELPEKWRKNFSTNSWPSDGLPITAEFYSDYLKIPQTDEITGCSYIDEVELVRTNLVFDYFGSLEPCTMTDLPDGIDIDGDGMIGTPQGVITPAPEPDPVVDPNPVPEPDPVVDPNPAPEPDPVVDPNPAPEPDPVVDPNPAPEPDPVFDPDPVVDPNPVPEPDPNADLSGSDPNDPNLNP